jgi:hypothetical protein
MSVSDYRLERIERAAKVRRLERIKAELDSMPPRDPPTLEELRQLQIELGIPVNVMAELFGEIWNQ